jgi:ATP-binding cassette subfamily C protein
MQALGDAANLILLTIVSAALLLVQGAIILVLSPILALLILALLCIVAFGLKPLFRRSRELGTILNETSLGLVTSTTHFLGGLKLALSQNLQGSFVAKFRSLLDEVKTNRVEFARQRALAQVAFTAIPASIAALVILIGIGVMDTHPPLVIGFLLVLGRMAGPATRVQGSLQQIWHALPAYGAIRKLEEELYSAETFGTGEESSGVPRGPLRFERAGYWHGDRDGADRRVGGVFDIDLTIPEGMFIGLTGSSGAGKTTLADLLVGLYPPLSGRVTVGGKELTGPMLAAWRERISYVSQDPFLFHDTVRNNLLWARPDASEADVWAALRSAGAEDMVRGMEAGLDTMVGERGTLVSGGERQRIALARALLRKPSLLVLDEATNAIDVAGEQEILSRLARQEHRPTIVMIAHRDASLQLCERIVELRDGRIHRMFDKDAAGLAAPGGRL